MYLERKYNYIYIYIVIVEHSLKLYDFYYSFISESSTEYLICVTLTFE
jgi:hypothetical protein